MIHFPKNILVLIICFNLNRSRENMIFSLLFNELTRVELFFFDMYSSVAFESNNSNSTSFR